MKTIIGGINEVPLGGKIISEGGLVAFPTETVYGLGANAFDAEAVKSIFIAKGRPQDNPLIVHIADISEAKNVAKFVPDTFYTLAEKFCPGPLTMILPKCDSLPLTTTGGLQTVGIRCPNHEMARALIRAAGCPIAAPSANISGKTSPTEARHVYEDMNGKIPLILDGGKTAVGIESTVLDLTKELPIVLRPGAVTVEMLAAVLGKVVNHKGEVIIAEAPGMKYKHYAPTCPCIGADTPKKATEEYNLLTASDTPVIIGSSDFVAACAPCRTISLGTTPAECTSNLFSTLRDAEKVYTYIILEWFPDSPEYFAINNRIHKSTASKCL